MFLVHLQSSDGLRGVITFWRVEIRGDKGQIQQRVVVIALNAQGERCRRLEQLDDALFGLEPGSDPLLDPSRRADLVRNVVPEMIVIRASWPTRAFWRMGLRLRQGCWRGWR